jgi:hypothetical protein
MTDPATYQTVSEGFSDRISTLSVARRRIGQCLGQQFRWVRQRLKRKEELAEQVIAICAESGIISCATVGS